MDIARILCPLDLHEASEEHVFEYALDMAEGLGASLHVLHVMEGPDSDNPLAIERALGQSETRLAALVQRAKGRAVELTTDTRPGVPHREIVAEADARGIDLMIVGTHARSGVARVLLGSVAERVLRSARTPVLTLPYGKGPFAAPTSILVGHDFSQRSRRALEHARGLGERLSLPVHVVHVAPSSTDGPGGEVQSRLESDVTSVFGAEGSGVSSRVVSGSPPERLDEVRAEVGADLVVVGSTGKGAIERSLLGTTPSKLVRRSQVPVLTIV